MKLTDLQINHLTCPIGYNFYNVNLSYKIIDSKGKYQKEAEVQVALDDKFENVIYSSGKKGDISPFSFNLELDLQPRTRYYVLVTSYSDAGENASEQTFFETGKMNEQWNSSWITTDVVNPVIKKDFKVSKDLLSARLYITGLGIFTPYINNEKITNEYLTPYLNNYNDYFQVMTYDIKDYLKGSNVLKVKLGDGWYKGWFGYNRIKKPCYGEEYLLNYELHLEYADGTKEVIVSDESNKVYSSNIPFTSIYNGERRNDTLKEEYVKNAIIKEGVNQKLLDRISPKVIVKEEVKVKEIIHTKNNELVLDMGQNFAGIFRLHVTSNVKDVKLEFGEVLQDDCFFNTNYRNAEPVYTYISDGIEKDVIPEFTFYGYRYVKVTGYDSITKDDFVGLSINSEFNVISKIDTHNKLVNRLVENALWGLKSNFIDIPMDCPQRDERLGWTGDAQVFSKTALYFTDAFAFYAKYFYDMRSEQVAHHGLVPYIIPAVQEEKCSSVWSDACCIIPWNCYIYSNDESFLKNNLPLMEDWVGYCLKRDDEPFGYFNKEWHYGDWLALDKVYIREIHGRDRAGITDKAYIAYTYLLNNIRIIYQSLCILNIDDKQEYYKSLIEKYEKFIKDNYFTTEGRCKVHTETGYILASYFDLTDNIEGLREDLITIFKENNNMLTSGFVGAPIMLNALSKVGLDDLAYHLLLNEEFPSWLYAVKMGATTIWERWNSIMPDGKINPEGMNSLNHYAYGSVVDWIYGYSLGLRFTKDKNTYNEIVLNPHPNYKLDHITGSISLPSGLLKVDYQLDKNIVTFKINVPFNTKCLFKLSCFDNAELLEKEKYHFENDNIILEHGTYLIEYKL